MAIVTQHGATIATDATAFWTSPLVEVKILATAHAARTMMLIPPSSAAAERTFSLLDALFGDLQHSALGHLQAAALMARCNALYREA